MISFTKHGGLELVVFANQKNLTFIINLIKRKHGGNSMKNYRKFYCRTKMSFLLVCISWYLIFALPIILSCVMVISEKDN